MNDERRRRWRITFPPLNISAKISTSSTVVSLAPCFPEEEPSRFDVAIACCCKDTLCRRYKQIINDMRSNWGNNLGVGVFRTIDKGLVVFLFPLSFLFFVFNFFSAYSVLLLLVCPSILPSFSHPCIIIPHAHLLTFDGKTSRHVKSS